MGFALSLYVRAYHVDKLHIGELLFVWIEFGHFQSVGVYIFCWCLPLANERYPL